MDFIPQQCDVLDIDIDFYALGFFPFGLVVQGLLLAVILGFTQMIVFLFACILLQMFEVVGFEAEFGF